MMQTAVSPPRQSGRPHAAACAGNRGTGHGRSRAPAAMAARLLALCLAGLPATPAAADDGRAIRPPVAAQQDERSPEGRHDPLRRGGDEPTAIVARHPPSHPAAKLAAGEATGAVSLARVGATLAAALRAQWCVSHGYSCLIDYALAAAGKIERSSDKAIVLAAIAAAQAGTGDAKGAQATVETALAAAGKAEGDRDKTVALASIAQAQARAGDAKGARATVKTALAIAGKIAGVSDRGRVSCRHSAGAGQCGRSAGRARHRCENRGRFGQVPHPRPYGGGAGQGGRSRGRARSRPNRARGGPDNRRPHRPVLRPRIPSQGAGRDG